MLDLVIETLGSPPRPVTLEAPRNTIGRSGRADLPLDDPFISRLHCELRCDGDTHWVTDLGSANGTRLNGVPLQEPMRLAPGDEIGVGETTLRVRRLGQSPRASETVRLPDLGRAEPRPVVESSPGSILETVFTRVARASPSGEVRTLERADLLSVVSRVGVALLSSASLDDVLYEVLDLVFDLTPAERAFILLTGREGEPEVRAASYRGGARITQPGELLLSGSIQREVLDGGRAVLTSDALEDLRFSASDSVELSGVRSVMAAPLTTGEGVLGMIEADSALHSALFGEEELELLSAIGSVAAIKVENTLLLEERLEHERLRQQLESARIIQSRLFPHGSPQLPGYDIRGISLPCYAVGGDYFDFETLAQGRLGITLGDVSGKGLDAALLMSSVHASVRAQAHAATSLVDLVERVNRYLCAYAPPNKFASLFCGLLDAERHRLLYVNAGNNPSMLLRPDGEVELLGATGMPIGLGPESNYTQAEVEIEPGGLLVVCSDGLTEAESPEGEEFGTARLLEVLRAERHLSTARLRDRIDEELLQFTGDQPPTDDLTLVLIKRHG